MTALLFLRANWKWFGLGALLLALATQTYRIASLKALSASLEARNAKQVSDYRTAYNRVVQDALAEKTAREAANEKARIAAAQTHDRVSVVYRDRVMRLPAADPRGSGEADLPGNAGSAGLPAQPAGDSVLLARSDALICAANTSYALGAYEWARHLAHPQ